MCLMLIFIPKEVGPKEAHTRHIIITLPKIKERRISKAAREKETVTKEFPEDCQLISQKKPWRQEGAGNKYSKS